MMALFKDYIIQNCGKGGKQKENLTKNESLGLKSIKKRISEGEIVMVPTDKRGNFAVMSSHSYTRSGMVHTVKDRESSFEEVKEAQKEANGHISMLIKVFKIGSRLRIE